MCQATAEQHRERDRESSQERRKPFTAREGDIESRVEPRPRESCWKCSTGCVSQATGYAGRQENIAEDENIARTPAPADTHTLATRNSQDLQQQKKAAKQQKHKEPRDPKEQEQQDGQPQA